MNLPRVTVSTLLGLVAVVGVNFAVARILITENDFLVYPLSLLALCLEIGVYRLIPSQGRISWFWYGFVVSGLLALSSSLWASSYGNRAPADSPLGRLIWQVWAGYVSVFTERVHLIPDDPRLFRLRVRRQIPLRQGMTISVVLLAPHLLAALAGGLIARRVAQWTRFGVPPGPGEGAARV